MNASAARRGRPATAAVGCSCSRQRLSSGAASSVQMQRRRCCTYAASPPAAAGRPASRPHSAGAGRYPLPPACFPLVLSSSSTSRPVAAPSRLPDGSRRYPPALRCAAARRAGATAVPAWSRKCLPGIERHQEMKTVKIAAPASRHDAHGVQRAATAGRLPAPALLYPFHRR